MIKTNIYSRVLFRIGIVKYFFINSTQYQKFLCQLLIMKTAKLIASTWSSFSQSIQFSFIPKQMANLVCLLVYRFYFFFRCTYGCLIYVINYLYNLWAVWASFHALCTLCSLFYSNKKIIDFYIITKLYFTQLFINESFHSIWSKFLILQLLLFYIFI